MYVHFSYVTLKMDHFVNFLSYALQQSMPPQVFEL